MVVAFSDGFGADSFATFAATSILVLHSNTLTIWSIFQQRSGGVALPFTLKSNDFLRTSSNRCLWCSLTNVEQRNDAMCEAKAKSKNTSFRRNEKSELPIILPFPPFSADSECDEERLRVVLPIHTKCECGFVIYCWFNNVGAYYMCPHPSTMSVEGDWRFPTNKSFLRSIFV